MELNLLRLCGNVPCNIDRFAKLVMSSKKTEEKDLRGSVDKV